jgi:hypothetical protein
MSNAGVGHRFAPDLIPLRFVDPKVRWPPNRCLVPTHPKWSPAGISPNPPSGRRLLMRLRQGLSLTADGFHDRKTRKRTIGRCGSSVFIVRESADHGRGWSDGCEEAKRGEKNGNC